MKKGELLKCLIDSNYVDKGDIKMYAMLTMDLDKNTTSKQRDKFYESLAKEEWSKIEGVTTTWVASWPDGALESRIIRTTKNDLDQAAASSGVTSYNAVISISSSMPHIL